MVKTLTIYVEGGGDSDEIKRRCREGFRKLFEKCDFKLTPDTLERYLPSFVRDQRILGEKL